MIKNPFKEDLCDGSYVEAQAIIDCVGDFLEGEGKSLLYVGANCSRAFFLDVLHDCKFTIDILEIFDQNIECIKNQYKYNNLIQGNIKNKDIISFYDVIFWYHGPEHVTKEDFIRIDEFLSKKSNVIILGCPYNDDVQGEVYGNIYEKHLWKTTPEDFSVLGYSVFKHERKEAFDNIIAWKKNNINI